MKKEFYPLIKSCIQKIPDNTSDLINGSQYTSQGENISVFNNNAGYTTSASTGSTPSSSITHNDTLGILGSTSYYHVSSAVYSVLTTGLSSGFATTGAYVPYMGSTSDVNLGNYDLITSGTLTARILYSAADPDVAIDLGPAENIIHFHPGYSSGDYYVIMYSESDDATNPRIYPNTANSGKIGTTSNRWNKIYAVNGSFSSDISANNGTFTSGLSATTGNFSSGINISAGATISSSLTLSQFSTAGFVKNTAGGVFTGGNAISSSDITGGLGFTPENVANKAVDFSVINDTKYPSVQAVNNAITTAVTGLLDYRGSYDCSTNLFPATGGSGLLGAVLKGDFWICSVVGTLGGVSVALGDLIISLVDTPAQIASNWDLIQYNLGFTPENVANKKTDLSDNSDTYYPSQKAVKTAVELRVPYTGSTGNVALGGYGLSGSTGTFSSGIQANNAVFTSGMTATTGSFSSGATFGSKIVAPNLQLSSVGGLTSGYFLRINDATGNIGLSSGLATATSHELLDGLLGSTSYYHVSSAVYGVLTTGLSSSYSHDNLTELRGATSYYHLSSTELSKLQNASTSVASTSHNSLDGILGSTSYYHLSSQVYAVLTTGLSSSYSHQNLTSIQGSTQGYHLTSSNYDKVGSLSSSLTTGYATTGAYVPYSGATSNVVLGSYSLSGSTGTFSSGIQANNAVFTSGVTATTGNFSSGIQVLGAGSFGGNVDFSSGIDVTGTIAGSSNCTIASYLQVTSGLSATTGNFSSSVDILGNLDVSSGITATTGNFSGGVQISSGLTVLSTATFSSAVTMLNNLAITSGMTATTGNFSCGVDIGGNLDITSGLTASTCNLSGGLNVTSGATVGNTLVASSSLTVGSTANISSSLYVAGDINCTGNSTFSKRMTLSSSVDITATATMSSNMSVSNQSYLSSAVVVAQFTTAGLVMNTATGSLVGGYKATTSNVTTSFVVNGSNISQLNNDSGYSTTALSSTTFVPYTGATSNVALGAYSLSGATGTFSSGLQANNIVVTSGITASTANFSSSVDIGGNLDITSGWTATTGNLSGGLRVTSGISATTGQFSSSVTIMGNEEVAGYLWVTSGIVASTGNISSNLNVGGHLGVTSGMVATTGNFSSSVDIGGNLDITSGFTATTGNLSGGLSVSSGLEIGSTGDFASSVYIMGALTVNAMAAISLASGVTISSAIYISNTVTMSSNATISGGLTVSSSLGVQNTARFSSYAGFGSTSPTLSSTMPFYVSAHSSQTQTFLFGGTDHPTLAYGGWDTQGWSAMEFYSTGPNGSAINLTGYSSGTGAAGTFQVLNDYITSGSERRIGIMAFGNESAYNDSYFTMYVMSSGSIAECMHVASNKTVTFPYITNVYCTGGAAELNVANSMIVGTTAQALYYGTIASKASIVGLTRDGSAYNPIYFRCAAADAMVLSTSGNLRFVSTGDSGIISIGTTGQSRQVNIMAASNTYFNWMSSNNTAEGFLMGVEESVDPNRWILYNNYSGGSSGTHSGYIFSVNANGCVGVRYESPTYAFQVASTSGTGSYNAFFNGDVSAQSFTDRTPYPKDKQEAYDAIMSIQRSTSPDKGVNHSKLHSFVKTKSRPELEKDSTGYEPYGRDLSATVSAQNEVIKDLIKRIETLEKI